MKANRLQLNPANTEVLWCASARRQHVIPTESVRVGDASLSPVTAVRDLGVYIDANSRRPRVSCRCSAGIEQSAKASTDQDRLHADNITAPNQRLSFPSVIRLRITS